MSILLVYLMISFFLRQECFRDDSNCCRKLNAEVYQVVGFVDNEDRRVSEFAEVFLLLRHRQRLIGGDPDELTFGVFEEVVDSVHSPVVAFAVLEITTTMHRVLFLTVVVSVVFAVSSSGSNNSSSSRGGNGLRCVQFCLFSLLLLQLDLSCLETLHFVFGDQLLIWNQREDLRGLFFPLLDLQLSVAGNYDQRAFLSNRDVQRNDCLTEPSVAVQKNTICSFEFFVDFVEYKKLLFVQFNLRLCCCCCCRCCFLLLVKVIVGFEVALRVLTLMKLICANSCN